MKLIGRKNSSNVQKVLWCCAELGIKYEHQDAGREFGVVDTDEFFQINPNRRVPVLIDGNFILWESNAIVRMLSAKYGMGKLFPKDLQTQANAGRWMDWQLATLGPDFTAMFHGLVRDKRENRQWDAINKSIIATQKNLQILDQFLAEQEFLAGENLTMGDIPAGIYVYRWYEFDEIDRKPLPNLERWYAKLTERPAFKECVMVGLG